MARFCWIVGLVLSMCLGVVYGIGCNWGTQATHPLPAASVVQMLKDNGIQKVKLFEADPAALDALSNSGIQVMVGIPNDMLATLAKSSGAAEKWVAKNVSAHSGVDIRYVAVGNEPFLSTYNESFVATTYPALQNIQSAITKAGLSSKVKVTVPLNADVYESSTNSNLPSTGDFRANIRDPMLQIVKFLNDNGSPFTVNIYPFISLYDDASFPVDYAFFDGYSSPINDGGLIYENVFDANHDTLVSALTKNGYPNMSIIVGEIGWPTDGDRNANPTNAQRFNQGFMNRVLAGKGTPMRPAAPDAYLFSLIDEDAKSIKPGNFERHWGLFYFDGTTKYQLDLKGTSNSGTGTLVAAQNVKYLSQKWCIMSPSASLDDAKVAPSVSYACSRADCTSLGYGTSCGSLDARGNVSYAFNSYYQQNNQLDVACKFSNLGTVTTTNPSSGNCSFRIMIEPTIAGATGVQARSSPLSKPLPLVVFTLLSLCTFF